MTKPRGLVFGAIPGIGVGSWFPSFAAMNAVGLHRPTVGGIGGRAAEGADSIVLNGGYKDDKDFGDRIIYTGMGGQDTKHNQVVDQEWAIPANAALRRNAHQGLPVRVIRGWRARNSISPSTGFRYDGLYRVVEARLAKSTDGPIVCQIRPRARHRRLM